MVKVYVAISKRKNLIISIIHRSFDGRQRPQHTRKHTVIDSILTVPKDNNFIADRVISLATSYEKKWFDLIWKLTLRISRRYSDRTIKNSVEQFTCNKLYHLKKNHSVGLHFNYWAWPRTSCRERCPGSTVDSLELQCSKCRCTRLDSTTVSNPSTPSKRRSTM